MPIKPTDMPPVEVPGDTDVIPTFPSGSNGRKWTVGRLREEIQSRASEAAASKADVAALEAEAEARAAAVAELDAVKANAADLGTAATRNVGTAHGQVPLVEKTVGPNAERLQSGVIAAHHLNETVLEMMGGGVTYAKEDRLGQVEALDFDFPDPATSEGKWYDVLVSGTASGDNAPSSDLDSGGLVYSNGTDWISVKAKPTNLGPKSVQYEHTASRVQSMLDVGNSINTFELMVAETVGQWFSPLSGRKNEDGSWDVFSLIDNETGNFQAYYNPLDQNLWGVITKCVSHLGGMYEYTGTGRIPLFTDADFRVLLEVDPVTMELTGLPFAGIGGGGDWAGDDFGTLPAEDAIELADFNQILYVGESTSVGAAGQPALSTTANPALGNLTWDVGPKASKTGGTVGNNDGMAGFKALAEDNLAADGGSNRGETGCYACANYASELLYREAGVVPSQRVFFISSAGHGGYRLNQLDKGTPWYQLALDHIETLAELAADDGKTAALQVLCFSQGANEQVGVQTREAYLARLLKYRDDLEADASAAAGKPVAVHLVLHQTTYNSRLWDDIVLAQLDAALQHPRIHLTGPTYHMPYAGDGVHLTNEGYIWQGLAFGRAVAALHAGKVPKWIKPLGAVVHGNVVEVQFQAPSGLVLDTVNLQPVVDMGFKVLTLDDTEVMIANVRAARNKVYLTLAETPGANVKVRYALDYAPTGSGITEGAGGNLVDSTPERAVMHGKTYPMFYVAPHFELEAINIL